VDLAVGFNKIISSVRFLEATTVADSEFKVCYNEVRVDVGGRISRESQRIKSSINFNTVGKDVVIPIIIARVLLDFSRTDKFSFEKGFPSNSSIGTRSWGIVTT